MSSINPSIILDPWLCGRPANPTCIRTMPCSQDSFHSSQQIKLWASKAHINPLSKNLIGTLTCLLRKYSPTPFPRPSILEELAIPPSRKSMIRLFKSAFYVGAAGFLLLTNGLLKYWGIHSAQFSVLRSPSPTAPSISSQSRATATMNTRLYFERRSRR